MQKIDKETLLDLHISMVELVKEIRNLLKLEAPSQVYERSKGWIDQIEEALGGGNYVDVYTPTFWLTLEELNIIKMDGTTAELKDDNDDDDGLDDDEDMVRECPRCLVQYSKGTIKCATKNCGRSLDVLDERPQTSNTSFRIIDNGTPETDVDGTIRWKNKSGQLHRTNGPAVEGRNGHREWWINGRQHRTDGPAIIFPGGDQIWYNHGQYHRVDGPAIDFANGHKVWYRFGSKIEPYDKKDTTPTNHSYESYNHHYDHKSLYRDGWERTFSNGKPSINDGPRSIFDRLNTKENDNEGEDFVEVDYVLDEGKKEGEGNQIEVSAVVQQPIEELVEVASERPSIVVSSPTTTTTTIATIPTRRSSSDEKEANEYAKWWEEQCDKHGIPPDFRAFGEFGYWGMD